MKLHYIAYGAVLAAAMPASPAFAEVVSIYAYAEKIAAISDNPELLTSQKDKAIREFAASDTVVVFAKIEDLAVTEDMIQVALLDDLGYPSFTLMNGVTILRFGMNEWYSIALAKKAASWSKWDRLELRLIPRSNGQLRITEDSIVRHIPRRKYQRPAFPGIEEMSYLEWFENTRAMSPADATAERARFQQAWRGWLIAGRVVESSQRDLVTVRLTTRWAADLLEGDGATAIAQVVDPELQLKLRTDETVALLLTPATPQRTASECRLTVIGTEESAPQPDFDAPKPKDPKKTESDPILENLEMRVKKWLKDREKLECGDCNGTSWLECSKCKGAGTVLVVGESRRRTCSKCNGAKRLDCGDCTSGVSDARSRSFVDEYAASDAMITDFLVDSIRIQRDGENATVTCIVQYPHFSGYQTETTMWLRLKDTWVRR